MRDLANAVKRGVLDPKKKPSTQMVGLAATNLSKAAFQPSGFQNNAFQTRTYIVSKTAPDQFVDFEKGRRCSYGDVERLVLVQQLVRTRRR